MKILALAVMLLPLFAFCVVGFKELRSDRTWTAKTRSLIPVILGIAALGLSLQPQGLLYATMSSSTTLNHLVTMISAVVACSGVFITYSRKSSAIWMAFGGLLLVFFSMLNRVV